MFSNDGIRINQIVPIDGIMEKEIWDDMDIYLNGDNDAAVLEEDPLTLSLSSLFSFETDNIKKLESRTHQSTTAVTAKDSNANKMPSQASSQVNGFKTEAEDFEKGACLTQSNGQLDSANHPDVVKSGRKTEEKGGMSPCLSSAPSTPISSSVSDLSDIFDDDMTEFSDDSKDTILNAASFSSEISDEELISLSVRELNKKLKDFSRTDILRFKQRRRLLKNRGYAQKCRTRRVQQYKNLSEDNSELYKQIEDLKEMVRLYQKERDEYKSKYVKLKSKLSTAKHHL